MKLSSTVIIMLLLLTSTVSFGLFNQEGTSPPIVNQTSITITISGNTFSPNHLDLTAGDVIDFTVTNDDGVSHSFTIIDSSDTQVLDIDVSPSSTETGTWTVPSDGDTYSFYCRYHPSMTGTIDITGESSETTTSETTTSETTTSETTTSNTTTSDTTTSNTTTSNTTTSITTTSNTTTSNTTTSNTTTSILDDDNSQDTEDSNTTIPEGVIDLNRLTFFPNILTFATFLFLAVTIVNRLKNQK